jgi:hypothetical protein
MGKSSPSSSSEESNSSTSELQSKSKSEESSSSTSEGRGSSGEAGSPPSAASSSASASVSEEGGGESRGEQELEKGKHPPKKKKTSRHQRDKTPSVPAKVLKREKSRRGGTKTASAGGSRRGKKERGKEEPERGGRHLRPGKKSPEGGERDKSSKSKGKQASESSESSQSSSSPSSSDDSSHERSVEEEKAQGKRRRKGKRRDQSSSSLSLGSSVTDEGDFDEEADLNPLRTLRFVRGKPREKLPSGSEKKCGACTVEIKSGRKNGKPTFSHVFPTRGHHPAELWCSKCTELALNGEICSIDRGSLKEKKERSVLLVPINFATYTLCTREIEEHRTRFLLGKANSIANRMVVFRFGKSLVVLNPVAPSKDGSEPFRALRRLAEQTETEVSDILVPGDEHFTSLPLYLTEFPRATGHLPMGRIERILEVSQAVLSSEKKQKSLLEFDNLRLFDASVPRPVLKGLEDSPLSVVSLLGIREGSTKSGPYANYPLGTSQQLIFIFEDTKTMWNGSHLFFFYPENEKHPPGRLVRHSSGLKKGETVNFLKPKEEWVRKGNKPVVVAPALLELSVKEVLAMDFQRLGDLHTGPNVWGVKDKEDVADLFDWVLDDKMWDRVYFCFVLFSVERFLSLSLSLSLFLFVPPPSSLSDPALMCCENLVRGRCGFRAVLWSWSQERSSPPRYWEGSKLES